MSITHFLDANIILELPIPDEGYYLECESLFNMPNIKKTSEKIINEEVHPINNERINILNDMIIFFLRTKKYRKYEAKRTIGQNTYYFKEDVLEKINKKDPKQILRGLKEILSFIKICFTERMNKISLPLIKRNMNHNLIQDMFKIINDEDDACHIVDALGWCISNKSNMIFYTINSEHITEKITDITQCLCLNIGCTPQQCPLKIQHVKSIA